MTLELVPFDRRHLEDFRPGRHDIAHVRSLRRQPGWEGKAVAAREDNRTLGIAGIGICGDTAHVWLVLSDEMRKRPVTLCRLAKAFLRGAIEHPEVARICIEVDGDRARRWAEWLGFKSIDSRRMAYGGANFAEAGVHTINRHFRSRYD